MDMKKDTQNISQEKISYLISVHDKIKDAAATDCSVSARLHDAIILAANWYNATEIENVGNITRISADGRSKTVAQAELITDGEDAAGVLLQLLCCLDERTKLAIAEERVDRDGISYPQAWESIEADIDAVARLHSDFINLPDQRGSDTHIRAVVEILAAFWEHATETDITQHFIEEKDPVVTSIWVTKRYLAPESPASRFICDVVEAHITKERDVQDLVYFPPKPEPFTKEAWALRTQKMDAMDKRRRKIRTQMKNYITARNKRSQQPA